MPRPDKRRVSVKLGVLAYAGKAVPGTQLGFDPALGTWILVEKPLRQQFRGALRAIAPAVWKAIRDGLVQPWIPWAMVVGGGLLVGWSVVLGLMDAGADGWRPRGGLLPGKRTAAPVPLSADPPVWLAAAAWPVPGVFGSASAAPPAEATAVNITDQRTHSTEPAPAASPWVATAAAPETGGAGIPQAASQRSNQTASRPAIQAPAQVRTPTRSQASGPASSPGAVASRSPARRPVGRPSMHEAPSAPVDHHGIREYRMPADELSPDRLVAIIDESTVVVLNPLGVPTPVRVGQRLPSGTPLLQVDAAAGSAVTGQGLLRLEPGGPRHHAP